MTFQLRDYQSSIVNALASAPHTPGERLLVQVATGGGKTAIMSEFMHRIAAHEHPNRRVLVVTKDWHLLGQAARDYATRYGARHRIGYWGKGVKAREAFGSQILRSNTRSVTYTTIHSWAHSFRRLGRFKFVIIDELHWGEGAPLYSKLMQRYANSCTFIGFTATPRNWTSFKLVDRAYDFAELLNRGVLARPDVEAPRHTNIVWDAELTSEHGDFTQASLRKLAASRIRNKLILDTYAEGRERYGKTIAFACNIDHAEHLARMFEQRGIGAGVVHHKVDDARAVIRAFEHGPLDILINVSMLTHGVDIPSIRTVFLTRPTTSDILFSQMIGRGSRKCEGKDSFCIVDFVDNVVRYGVPIIRPDGYFGMNKVLRGELQKGETLEQHTFQRVPFVKVEHTPGREAITGLDVQPEQTFGIEFEVAPRTGSEYITEPVFVELYNAVKSALEGKVVIDRSSGDHRTWSFKRDSSCGIEITTRVLKGVEGFHEVHDVLGILMPILNERGYRVDMRTGTHVHLGWAGAPFKWLKNLIRSVAYYEPAIYSLVSPSRVGNQYAKSMRAFFKASPSNDKSSWKESSEHYDAVNFEGLWVGDRTLEIRYHNGTLEAVKILPWISLWMRLLDTACVDANYTPDPAKRVRRVPLSPGERGDVLALANYVHAGEQLKRRLMNRRHDVVGGRAWQEHPKWSKIARTMHAKWSRDRERYVR